MTPDSNNTESDSVEAVEWKPYELLENFLLSEINETTDSNKTKENKIVENTFFNCQPQGWLPGLATQWSLLLRSLNSNLNNIEVNSKLEVNRIAISKSNPRNYFYALIDEEPVALMFDFKTIEIISEILVPDSLSKYDSVVIEYVARRFFSTLVQCWSGPKITTFNFRRNVEFPKNYEFEFSAHFDINFQLNGQGCECKLLIGPKIKNILHELWHKQNNIEQDNTDSAITDDDYDVSDDAVFEVPEEPISIVISELAIPETDLSDYLESGTLINLEQNVDDRVSLKLNTDNSWMTGKLVTISDIDKFGIKIVESDVSEAEIAKGSVKASFVLGEIDKAEISKIDFRTSDVIFNTGVDVKNKVDIIVNNEQVAKGKLMIHDGNMAIEVL